MPIDHHYSLSTRIKTELAASDLASDHIGTEPEKSVVNDVSFISVQCKIIHDLCYVLSIISIGLVLYCCKTIIERNRKG